MKAWLKGSVGKSRQVFCSRVQVWDRRALDMTWALVEAQS